LVKGFQLDIAIFGGSFDPFHIGHEKIITKVLKELPISKLFIVPTFLNPFKNKSYINANIRLELIKDLYKNDDNIQIIDYETRSNHKVTTDKTINYLKQKYNLKRIYLIIGADNLKDIHLWYNFKKFKEYVTFVVISRDNIPLDNIYIKPIYIELDENISSTILRDNMDINYIPQKIQKKVKELWKKE
jgi:nicotinate-nucleotide adenylyltransferase